MPISFGELAKFACSTYRYLPFGANAIVVGSPYGNGNGFFQSELNAPVVASIEKPVMVFPYSDEQYR